jgi:hypothetical protein
MDQKRVLASGNPAEELFDNTDREGIKDFIYEYLPPVSIRLYNSLR